MTGVQLDPRDELEPLDELLARHGLADVAEAPFPNDGWSGAAMTRLVGADGRSFILKRDSLDRDWIGIPSEGFGFSNDAAPSLGPPSYESARFEHEGSVTTLHLSTRYGL